MKTTYSHLSSSSFYTWLNFNLSHRGESFDNYSGNMFHDPRQLYETHVVYNSPFKQIDYHSHNLIPSGININGDFVPTGQSGVFFDYANGRAFADASIGEANVTAEFQYKEFNTYYTNEPEEDLIVNRKYSPYKPNEIEPDGVYENEIILPAVFIKTDSSFNEPFAFGGMRITTQTFRTVIVTDSSYMTDGAMGLFSDLQGSYFPILEPNQTPLDANGTLKPEFSLGYDFLSIADSIPRDKYCYVNKVRAKAIPVQREWIDKIYVKVALVDFEVNLPRHT